MSVKLQVMLSIIILTILGIFYIVGDLMDELRHDPEYTAQSSAAYTDDFGIFFMENWNDMGRLYRIEMDGDVLAVTGSQKVKMETSEALAYRNGKVYALYSSPETDADGSFLTYRIAVYDPDLELESISDLFTIDSSWNVCSMTVDGMCLYLSAITGNGGNVTVFSIPLQTLAGAEELGELSGPKEKDSPITRKDYYTPDSILYRARTTNRFYVNARYVDPELYVLLDGETPKDSFAPDTRVKAAVDSISFTLGQRIGFHAALIIRTIGFLLIWIIIVLLIQKVTKDRDRIVYLFLMSEVVLFTILFIAYIFLRNQLMQNEINNNSRFALMVMQEELNYYSSVDYGAEDFFESTKYYKLMDSLTDVLSENHGSEVFYDTFVMRKSTGQILADAKGHTGMHASYLYGGTMSLILDQLQEQREYVSENFTLNGEEMTAVAYESENPADDIALVAICKDKNRSDSFKSSVRGLEVLFLVIFLVGSLFLFIALYMQHMDLKRFSGALKKLALGEPKVESEKIIARDMRELWQSYGELAKRIEEINYDKYRIFEAYYRFAPKGIESIMGRESIFDVENGDVVSVSGAMVLLTVDRDKPFEKKVQSLSVILSSMEGYSNPYEGVLVSRDQTLSNVRFLMLNERTDMVSQIVQFIHIGKQEEALDWSILLYRDVITYGVAGSSTQSLVYIDSDYSRKMDAYAEWFRSLGVPLVATERIVKSENIGELRYVGCADIEEEGTPIRFYDVLDAYPADTRQLVLMNRDKFEETLELYYSKNFYLARNQFMDILKECPEDGITRWYVFECEKYMNGEADVSRSGYIQIED